MTNNKNDNTNETEYVATFTLAQRGLEGDVRSSFKMQPEPGDGEEFAAVHQIMSNYVSHFLYQMGMIDEEGNLLPEPSEDSVVVEETDTKH